ncbi:MAG: uracil-DNA glycosylase [Candidatus Hydrogenedentota bacterium]
MTTLAEPTEYGMKRARLIALIRRHIEAELMLDSGVVSRRPAARNEKDERMKALLAGYANCRLCRLCEERKTIVSGSGSVAAKLMIVGEAPGADEDEQGLPFVGRSGQLLTKMLASIGMAREDVYITNTVKCRPPANRNPEPDELSACQPFLRAQIEIIRPTLIVTLGGFAARIILGLDEKTPISRVRGQVYLHDGIRCIPTFHPAYLLRNPSAKKEAWQDLKKIRVLLDEQGAKS